jgi:hypothetical protein
MTATKIALFAGAAVVVAGGLALVIRNSSTSTSDGHGTIAAPAASMAVKQSDQLNPFTHVASIPANVDPSTIRFEKLKTVELASKTSTSTDPNCKDKQFREPDASNCQTVKVEEKVKAVEAMYSYNGTVISAGESVPGRDSFSVYFKPEEVATDGPADKLKRDQAASLFQVNIYRGTVEQKVIDKANSHFCEGSYVDGSWVRKDPTCQDQVQYINQTVPSPYLTVQVDRRASN